MVQLISDAKIENNTIVQDVYKIESCLSSSELSMVYKVEEVNSGQVLILKEFYPQSLVVRDIDGKTVLCRFSTMKKKFEELKQTFLEEAETLRSLQHEGIVKYVEHFEANGTVYILMEYCEGMTLDDYIQANEDQLLPEFLKTTFIPFLEAISYVHEQGFLHRDLKPKNVLVGENGKPTIIDFGSSITIESDEQKAIFTTKGYSPLEFYSDLSKQGIYSDMYSIAAILYFVLCGKPPIDAPSRVIEDSIEPIGKFNRAVTPWFAKMVMRSLHLQYQNRPTTPAEMIQHIKKECFFLKVKPKEKKTIKVLIKN